MALLVLVNLYFKFFFTMAPLAPDENAPAFGIRGVLYLLFVSAEEDEEILKHFTPEQRRIRREWRNKQAMKVSEEDRDKFLEVMKQAFIDMAGGANG